MLFTDDIGRYHLINPEHVARVEYEPGRHIKVFTVGDHQPLFVEREAADDIYAYLRLYLESDEPDEPDEPDEIPKAFFDVFTNSTSTKSNEAFNTRWLNGLKKLKDL